VRHVITTNSGNLSLAISSFFSSDCDATIRRKTLIVITSSSSQSRGFVGLRRNLTQVVRGSSGLMLHEAACPYFEAGQCAQRECHVYLFRSICLSFPCGVWLLFSCLILASSPLFPSHVSTLGVAFSVLFELIRRIIVTGDPQTSLWQESLPLALPSA